MRNINWIISSGFIITILWWLCWGFVAYKVYNVDWSGGIRPVIEKAWCGQPGCIK
jgi:hypothetical protein